MSDRNPQGPSHGPGRRRTPYMWEIERERRARRRRILGVALAFGFLAAVAIYIIADSYFTTVN